MIFPSTVLKSQVCKHQGLSTHLRVLVGLKRSGRPIGKHVLTFRLKRTLWCRGMMKTLLNKSEYRTLGGVVFGRRIVGLVYRLTNISIT